MKSMSILILLVVLMGAQCGGAGLMNTTRSDVDAVCEDFYNDPDLYQAAIITLTADRDAGVSKVDELNTVRDQCEGRPDQSECTACVVTLVEYIWP